LDIAGFWDKAEVERIVKHRQRGWLDRRHRVRQGLPAGYCASQLQRARTGESLSPLWALMKQSFAIP
jgi:hypothetical protein